MSEDLNFEFKAGELADEITVDRMNALLKGIKRAQPPEGIKGARLTRGPDGWGLSVDPGRGGSTDSFALEPIQSAPTKVKFRYGTCHGNVPKIDDVAITAELNDEDNPTLTVTGEGVIYVKVDLKADTYEAENPVLVFVEGDESSIPADVHRVSAHCALVGVAWDTESSSIASLAPVHKGSIDVASCAGVVNHWDLG